MKSPNDSATQTTHLVMPTDANTYGSAFGGYIMSLMDIAAGICASRHCEGPALTAAVDELVFKNPIRVGDVVIIKASVNYVGKTSMEVGVRVEREDHVTRTLEHCLSGYFTFVAVYSNGRPILVKPLMLNTDEEKRRHNEGKARKENRTKERKF